MFDAEYSSFRSVARGYSLRSLSIVFAVTAALSLIATMSRASTMSVFAQFTAPQGAQAWDRPTVDTDNTIYGVNVYGGAHDHGALFAISPEGKLLWTYSFTGAAGGNSPASAPVISSDGNLYGLTMSGGLHNCGIAYRIAKTGTGFVALHSFSAAEGYQAMGPLVQYSPTMFYGALTLGGLKGFGSVFSLTTAGQVKVLHGFSGGDGAYPRGALTISADRTTLYGSAGFGGNGFNGGTYSGNGLVFAVNLAGGESTVHAFSFSDGAYPNTGLFLNSDGSLTGTTYFGGASEQGVLFNVTPSGSFAVIHAFAGSDGANPDDAMVQGGDGALYGMTNYGDSNNSGVLFKLTSGGVFSVVASDPSTAVDPFGGLSVGSNGLIYSFAEGLGASPGSIFSVSTTGEYAGVYSFTFPNGLGLYGKMALAPTGDYEGVSAEGGNYGYGTVFKMLPTGELKTIHSFDLTDGAEPLTGLVQGPGGALYGTTIYGGTDWSGTIFEITPTGTFRTVHDFAGVNNGAPTSLIYSGGSSLYGLFATGGAYNDGGFFSFTPPAKFTIVHSFALVDGRSPISVVQGADGAFYAVMNSGGTHGYGTIIRIDGSTGKVSVLHDFESGEWYPQSGLVSGSDGLLYGVLDGNETTTYGLVYSMSTAGVYTVLHTFSGAGAEFPYGPLVETSPGVFCGAINGSAPTPAEVFSITSTGDFAIVGAGKFNSPTTGLTLGADGSLYGGIWGYAALGYASIYKFTP